MIPHGNDQLIFLVAYLLAGGAAYLLPTMIAVLRRHPYRESIAVLNIFLGWTLLGWVGAMVWAVAPVTSEPASYSRPRHRVRSEPDDDEPAVIRRPDENPFA